MYEVLGYGIVDPQQLLESIVVDHHVRTACALDLRHLLWTKYRFGSMPAAYRALPQLPKWASAALTSAGTSRRIRP
jgi:hypothetical protein